MKIQLAWAAVCGSNTTYWRAKDVASRHTYWNQYLHHQPSLRAHTAKGNSLLLKERECIWKMGIPRYCALSKPFLSTLCRSFHSNRVALCDSKAHMPTCHKTPAFGVSQFAANAPIEDRYFVVNFSFTPEDEKAVEPPESNECRSKECELPHTRRRRKSSKKKKTARKLRWDRSCYSTAKAKQSCMSKRRTKRIANRKSVNENRDHLPQATQEQQSNNVTVFAVIDGHGGWQIADYVSRQLPSYIKRQLTSLYIGTTYSASDDEIGTLKGGLPLELKESDSNELTAAMARAFDDLDTHLCEAVKPAFRLGFSRTAKCGACSCVVVVDNHRIVAVNVGDCKAVLCRNGQAIPLSRQHNANDAAERDAIKKAHPLEGDAVVCKKTWQTARSPSHALQYPAYWVGLLGHETRFSSCYVKGRLQPTRTFGDFHLKDSFFAIDREKNKPFLSDAASFPYVTVTPELSVARRVKDADEFVVVGSDGVWDFLSNEEVVNITRDHFRNDAMATPTSASEAVISAVLTKAKTSREEALLLSPRDRRAVFDDTTVCVLKLDSSA